MANDKKKLREVASCIRVLLKTDGTNAKVKDIVELIKDEDLTNPVALKDKIKNDMRAKQEAVASQPNRRDHLKAFIVKHYDIIKENPVVLESLKNSYCQGRFTKEQRQKMIDELLAECGDSTEVEATITATTAVEKTEETSGYDF
jgi:hypothetical protein